MPNLPVPGNLNERLNAAQQAIAAGEFDPVGANSTTFKYGTGSGDLAAPRTPTSPANFLMAATELSAAAQRSIPTATGKDLQELATRSSPKRNMKIVK